MPSRRLARNSDAAAARHVPRRITKQFKRWRRILTQFFIINTVSNSARPPLPGRLHTSGLALSGGKHALVGSTLWWKVRPVADLGERGPLRAGVPKGGKALSIHTVRRCGGRGPEGSSDPPGPAISFSPPRTPPSVVEHCKAGGALEREEARRPVRRDAEGADVVLLIRRYHTILRGGS